MVKTRVPKIASKKRCPARLKQHPIFSKLSQHRSKNILLHNTRDLDCCCYLQHFVAIEPPNTTQKVLQNCIKKSTSFRTSNNHPTSSKKVSTWVPLFRGWAPWGARGALLAAQSVFLTQNSQPKCSQNGFKDAKVTPKGCHRPPKLPQHGGNIMVKTYVCTTCTFDVQA